MLTMRPWLDKAGPYAVEHVGGIPHFSQPIDDQPRAGVLHTTEGSTVEGALAVFKQHYAPHFLVGRSTDGTVKIMQLVQVGTIGAALVTHNWLATVQVELVGFSREESWFPDADSAGALAALMSACRAEYDIPLTHPWPDDDWGRSGPNAHRVSGMFGQVSGWFGHQDVESPDTHWDPGHFQWSKIFNLAANVTHVPTPPVPVPPRPCGGNFDLDTDAGIWKALSFLNETTSKEEAVKSFQRAYTQYELTVDGVFGPKTKAAMTAELAASW